MLLPWRKRVTDLPGACTLGPVSVEVSSGSPSLERHITRGCEGPPSSYLAEVGGTRRQHVICYSYFFVYLHMALMFCHFIRYRTHDLRRGHAEDMRRSGCTLAQILQAGQWRSAAFLKYLDEVRLLVVYLNFQHAPSAHLCLQADLEKDVAYAIAIHSDDEEEFID